MLIFNKESKKKPPNFEPWTNQDDKNLEEQIPGVILVHQYNFRKGMELFVFH